MQQCYQWFVRVQVSILLLPVAALLAFCSAARPQATAPNSATGGIPNAATARKRAESIMAKKHWAVGPLTAKLQGGVWIVSDRMLCQEVLPKPGRACFGGAWVRLRKSDGSILEVAPPRNLSTQ